MAATPRRLPLLSLAGCRRIVIMGTTGSGKTTLAAHLARHLGVPRIELDELNWRPNWTMAPREQFRVAVDVATSGPAWVADGNYRAVRDILWPRADTIVWLDYPLVVNFWRLTRRNLVRIARREELWHGNRESIRSQFFNRESLYVWAAQSHRRHRREWTALFASGDYPHLAVVRLHSPGRTHRWLARVTGS
jgi:adenylate kinase family enzyme